MSGPDVDEGPLLCSKDVAGMLKKSRATVQRMVLAGELPYTHKLPGIRGAYLFSRPVIEMYLRTQTGETS